MKSKIIKLVYVKGVSGGFLPNLVGIMTGGNENYSYFNRIDKIVLPLGYTRY